MTSHQKPKGGRKWPWIVGIGAVVLIIAISCSGGGENTAGSSASSRGEPATPTSAPAQPEQAAYGQPLQADDLTVTVATPKKKTQQYIGTQVCARVSYVNNGSSPVSFNLFDWKFRTAQGVEASASAPFNSNQALQSGQLSPGGQVSGDVCSDTSISEASAVVYQPGFGFASPLVWSGD